MWHYLYLAVHLRLKPKTEYNGWESYVASEMVSKPPAFIPRLTAIALQHHEEEQNEEQRLLAERQKAMAAELSALVTTVGAMSRTLQSMQGHNAS